MYRHAMRERHISTTPANQTLLVMTVIMLLTWFAGAEATPFVPERVDFSSVASHTSLAIDAYGAPHLVYQSFGTDDLKYAHKSSGAWVFETVDAVGVVGDEAAIALDAQGNPHVSYYDATNGDLKYATKTGGVWSLEVVDEGGNVGSNTSIRVDSQGNPHISYSDQTNGDLKYAMKAAFWSIETVDAVGNTGVGTSLALDNRDAPRIAYWDLVNGHLRYASKAGGAWTLQTADAGGIVGAEPSLQLDAQGNPHISYKDVGLDDLKYASRSGNITWALETIDAGGNVGNHTSLSLDQNGNPRISYYDVTNTDLKYAVKSGGTWTLETVDAGPIGVGRDTSLAVDLQGNPSISYIESAQGPDFLPYIKFASSSVRVASQLAGVTWPVGSLRSVAWSGIGPVTISLSADGGATYQKLAEGIVANTVELRVPHTPTKFARIRVERASPISTSESDSSFTIQTSVALLELLAAPLPQGGATITWQTDPGPEDLSGYRLEKSSASSDWHTIVPLTRERSYTDADAGPATRYRLYAVNGFGEELLMGEAMVRPLAALSAWPIPYRSGDLSITFATSSGLGGGARPAEVTLYDVRGRLVRRITSGEYPAGYHRVVWDGHDSVGRPAASGVYFLVSRSAGEERRLKLVVVR